jgi:hypothetical protein
MLHFAMPNNILEYTVKLGYNMGPTKCVCYYRGFAKSGKYILLWKPEVLLKSPYISMISNLVVGECGKKICGTAILFSKLANIQKAAQCDN